VYGTGEQYSELELLIGKKHIERRHPLFEKHIRKKINELEKKPNTEKLIEELRSLL